MENKSGRCIVGSPSENQIVKHAANSILKFYLNLARSSFAKLSDSPNRYTMNFDSC